MKFQLPPDAARVVAEDDWEIYQSLDKATLYICPTSYHVAPFTLTHKNLAKLLLASIGSCSDDLKTALDNYIQVPDSSNHISSEPMLRKNIGYDPGKIEKEADQQETPKVRRQSTTASELNFNFGEPVVINQPVVRWNTRKLLRNPWMLGFLIFAIFIAYLEIAGSRIDKEDDINERANGSPGTAASMCQKFVKDRLKAPSTAVFPNPYDADQTTVLALGNGHYLVHSYVDAQNSFGAQVRTHYECDLRHTRGGYNWELQSVKNVSP